MARNFGILKKEQDKQLKRFNPEAPMDNSQSDLPRQYAPHPKPARDNDYSLWKIGSSIVLVIGSVFIAMVMVLFACSAQAHDHNKPNLDSWYRNLGSSRSPCCTGEEEGTKLLDAEWRMDHLENCKVTDGEVYGGNSLGTQYCVKIHDVWWLVPDSSIVKGSNLEGVAIVWPLISYGKNDQKQVNIRCFMPAPAY